MRTYQNISATGVERWKKRSEDALGTIDEVIELPMKHENERGRSRSGISATIIKWTEAYGMIWMYELTLLLQLLAKMKCAYGGPTPDLVRR